MLFAQFVSIGPDGVSEGKKGEGGGVQSQMVYNGRGRSYMGTLVLIP